MTVIVTRAVVSTVTIEAPDMATADQAFADLKLRVGFALPKLRFGDTRVKGSRVTVHGVTAAGRIEKAER